MTLDGQKLIFWAKIPITRTPWKIGFSFDWKVSAATPPRDSADVCHQFWYPSHALCVGYLNQFKREMQLMLRPMGTQDWVVLSGLLLLVWIPISLSLYLSYLYYKEPVLYFSLRKKVKAR